MLYNTPATVKLKIAILTIMLIVFTRVADLFAQYSFYPTDSTDFELQEVVVTGTRNKVQKAKIPASISIIQKEIIENSTENNVLPILHQQVPGLFLNERMLSGFGVGPVSAGNISIRGLSGTPNTQVLVLIDGQPQFMGLFGHPIGDSYQSEDIERVEIIRGPASLLYGSNAMGGAINLITAKAKKHGFSGKIKGAWGSAATGQFAASSAFLSDKWEIYASVNHSRTNGFRDDGKDNFNNTQGFAKIAFSPNEAWRFTVDGNISDAVFFDPGIEGMPFQDHDYRYERGRLAASIENRGDKIDGAFRGFYNFGTHDFFDGWHSEDQNIGFTFYQNLKLLKGNTITIGTDYKHFGGLAQNPNIMLNEDRDLNEIDFYILIQQEITENLTFNGGYRLVENSQYGPFSVPGLGLSWEYAQLAALKANVSRGFRSPTIVDYFIFPIANNMLLPESMWNYEISHSRHLLNSKLYTEFTLFYSSGDNLIVTLPRSSGPPQKVNAGKFTNSGIELLATYQPIEQLKFNLNYAWLHKEMPLPYAPEQQINVQAEYQWQKFKFIAHASQISGLAQVTTENPTETDYFLLNARLFYHVNKNLRVWLRGENLTDTNYQIDIGYPMPGITFMGGVDVSF
ncbi:MAG: TonB-dependent receptor [Bacteroidota bacterium]